LIESNETQRTFRERSVQFCVDSNSLDCRCTRHCGSTVSIAVRDTSNNPRRPQGLPVRSAQYWASGVAQRVQSSARTSCACGNLLSSFGHAPAKGLSLFPEQERVREPPRCLTHGYRSRNDLP